MITSDTCTPIIKLLARPLKQAHLGRGKRETERVIILLFQKQVGWECIGVFNLRGVFCGALTFGQTDLKSNGLELCDEKYKREIKNNEYLQH